MKKLFGIFVFLLITTNTTSFSVNSIKDSNVQNKNIYEILYENIYELSKIKNSDIKNMLLEYNNNVYFDIEKLSSFNFTPELLKILESKYWTNITISDLQSFGMFSNDNLNSLSADFYMPIRVTGPKHWWEWIIIYWRLHFDNKLSISIANGSATISDFTGLIIDAMHGVPGLGSLIVSIGLIISGVTSLSTGIFDKNNKGNVVYIRFAGLIPTGWGPSNYDFT